MSIGTEARRFWTIFRLSHAPFTCACTLVTQNFYSSFACNSTNNSGGGLVVKALRQCVLQASSLLSMFRPS